MTSNSDFKVTPLFDLLLSQKRYEIQTQLQWNTNRNIHRPCQFEWS